VLSLSKHERHSLGTFHLGNLYETFKRWSNAFLSLTSMDNAERMQNIQETMAYFGQMATARHR